MNSKIENHKKKKQTLTDLFKTLLHELMTGQRRVHELEFEGLNKEYKMEEQPLSMAAEK
jgi:type I restriction enzyme S subunit